MDGPSQRIMPLCGSILQAGTCQILSLAENPRWSRVWQYFVGIAFEETLGGGENFHYSTFLIKNCQAIAFELRPVKKLVRITKPSS